MTERTIRRRQVMLGAGAVAGGVAASGLASGTAALAGDGNRGDVTGSWLITHQDAGDPISGTFTSTVFDPSRAEAEAATGTFRGRRLDA